MRPISSPVGQQADDIIGNRVYAAWGVGDDGVMPILDRKKLLPPLSGVVAVPTPATLTSRPKLTCWRRWPGSFTCRPTKAATPLPGVRVEAGELPGFTEFLTRDIVLLASEATADLCEKRRTGASSSM